MDFISQIGNTEIRRDDITASPLRRLLALLDRQAGELGAGTALPPLAHWLYFLPDAPQSDLGPDGHPKRGGFLPDDRSLPRRMWAGGRLTFRDNIRIGMALERRSKVVAINPKQGALGRMLLVTVRHEYQAPDEPPLLVEEQDIVYRAKAPGVPVAAPQIVEPGQWRRAVMPDERLLFRYSALTFNAHRIHYDRDYATKVEGYQDLVVHGPLTATLLIDLLRQELPDAVIRSFSFCGVSPLFAREALHLNATPADADGKVSLWAANDSGGLAMRAEAVIGKPGGAKP